MPLHSMTGFGRAERTLGTQSVEVEVRAVNGRFLDVRVRQPWGVSAQTRLKRLVEARVGRGRVELGVRAQPNVSESGGPFAPPEGALRDVVAAALEVAEVARNAGLEVRDCSPLEILRFLSASSADSTWEEPEGLDAVVVEALEALVAMRATEGAALHEELARLLDQVERAVGQVAETREAEEGRLRARLRERLERLTQGGGLEPGRLEAEAALVVAKGDVTEELARVASHLSQARELMGADPHAGQGKKLDFLAQELMREVTTMGSKLGGSAHTTSLLDAKAAVERVREQVANVE